MALSGVFVLVVTGITTYTYLKSLSGYILYYGAVFSGIDIFFSGWAKRELAKGLNGNLLLSNPL